MACKARVLLPVSKSHKQQAHIQVHSATLGGRSPLAPTLLTPGAVRGAAAAAAASAAHCSRPLSTRCTQRAGPRAGARTLLRAAWGPLADQTLPSPAARRAPPRRGRAALERHWRHPRCCCCCRWRRGRAARRVTRAAVAAAAAAAASGAAAAGAGRRPCRPARDHGSGRCQVSRLRPALAVRAAGTSLDSVPRWTFRSY